MSAFICYDYQACETADYEGSEAYAIVIALRGYTIRLLDGYKDAEWEL